MDLYEVQEMIASQFPDKNVTFEFDESCHRFIEIVVTDGLPNVVHHIENNKVKVNVEGIYSFYLPIQPHRMNFTWTAIKELLGKKNDVHIHPTDLDFLKECDKDCDDYKAKMDQLVSFTGLSQKDIESKLK